MGIHRHKKLAKNYGWHVEVAQDGVNEARLLVFRPHNVALILGIKDYIAGMDLI